MRDGPSGLHRRSFASIAYSQLSLDGQPSEGGPDVLAAGDRAVAGDPDPGDVEAQAGEAALSPAAGPQPGRGQAPDPQLLSRADGQHRRDRAGARRRRCAP